jgi:hypothetical protein
MNRQEAIQLIIWSLLAHADAPREAVAAALTLKPHLGDRAESDFRNLLRAAGLFARDDDGFFMRYVRSASAQADPGSLPVPTHLLTVPVPVEPRMRIAYSVFTGLLLKHLYQSHAAVPLQVTEGMALLCAPDQPAAPASPLPDNAEQVWQQFRSSTLAESALQDGIESTFLGLRGGRPIGAVEVPHSWKETCIETLLRKAVDRNPRAFQTQSKKDKIQFASESKGTVAATPLSVMAINGATNARSAAVAMASGRRCLVCGSQGEMIQGGKFFLPENKKQWYEEPGPRDKFPKLCAACAYVALLSGISPSSNQSIVEFPADNFLEVFALYEHLQGVSGAVALKTLNRVATLSILPSRYLLLSKNSRRGQMDSKTQIYVQLRRHTPLLQNLDRPMRVQIEGNQPNFWSEVHPHVAIGLSHFVRMPNYYETKDRKVVAQRVTRALTEGRPYSALYLATQAQQPDKGFGLERRVLAGGLRAFENEFVAKTEFATKMVRALGGDGMNAGFYRDVIEFSNYLLLVTHDLVYREVTTNKTSVSGVARKYTDLLGRDFAEGRCAKFLYVVCQEVEAAERNEKSPAPWLKPKVFKHLYGSKPDTKNKSGEEVVGIWSDFRKQHPETLLETKIHDLYGRYGKDHGIWTKFLSEVQARTLALLMLNVRNVSIR